MTSQVIDTSNTPGYLSVLWFFPGPRPLCAGGGFVSQDGNRDEDDHSEEGRHPPGVVGR